MMILKTWVYKVMLDCAHYWLCMQSMLETSWGQTGLDQTLPCPIGRISLYIVACTYTGILDIHDRNRRNYQTAGVELEQSYN